MQIIRNLKDWTNYRKIQNNRVIPLEPIHKPENPNKYPCIVLSFLSSMGAKMVINHSFVYSKDAEKLLKY